MEKKVNKKNDFEERLKNANLDGKKNKRSYATAEDGATDLFIMRYFEHIVAR